MASEDQLPARRYIALARQLLAEDDASQHTVARRLGVTQPSLNGWLNGRALPKVDKIRRAITKMHLDARFFFDPTLGDSPDYRQHQSQDVRLEEAPNPAWDAFLESSGGALERFHVTDEEREHLRRTPFRGGAQSASDYANVLAAMLRVGNPFLAGFEAARDVQEARRARGEIGDTESKLPEDVREKPKSRRR